MPTETIGSNNHMTVYSRKTEAGLNLGICDQQKEEGAYQLGITRRRDALGIEAEKEREEN